MDVTVTVPTTDVTSDAYNVLGERYCEVSPNANAAGVYCPVFGASRVADSSTWTYDGDGNVLSATDADGHTTSYVYDANNQTQLTDPLGNVTKTRLRRRQPHVERHDVLGGLIHEYHSVTT